MKSMNKDLGAAVVLTVCLGAAPLATHAQQITYDFTGKITSSSVGSIADGMTITGTYTFDLANANPLDSDNGINTTSPWIRASLGGTAYKQPTPSGTVFSFSGQVGGTSLSSYSPSVLGSFSQVTGGGGFYSAMDTEWTSASSFTQSSLTLIDGGAALFTSAGTPVFPSGATGMGAFLLALDVTTSNGLQFQIGPQIDYTITSLTPVATHSAPEIDGASAIGSVTLLLGSLAVLRRARRMRVLGLA
jgi:hypothetical protein